MLLITYLTQLNESQTPFTVNWSMGQTENCVSEINEIDTFYQVLIRTPTGFIIPLVDLISISFITDNLTATVNKDGTVATQ